jgi:hypothetical protein
VLKEKVGLPVKEKTHTRPDGEEFKPGQVTEHGIAGASSAKKIRKTAPTKAKNKKRVKK